MTDITLPRAVVEQALDALKSSDESGCDEFLSIIDALEERLAQPEQEPVAWLYEAGNDRTLHWYKPPLYGTPLYTTPPQRKPLTDEQIKDHRLALGYDFEDLPDPWDFQTRSQSSRTRPRH
jgi:hypothetical protein